MQERPRIKEYLVCAYARATRSPVLTYTSATRPTVLAYASAMRCPVQTYASAKRNTRISGGFPYTTQCPAVTFAALLLSLPCDDGYEPTRLWRFLCYAIPPSRCLRPYRKHWMPSTLRKHWTDLYASLAGVQDKDLRPGLLGTENEGDVMMRCVIEGLSLSLRLRLRLRLREIEIERERECVSVSVRASV
eukprot:1230777-Rhodomonas_salina.1